MPCFSPASTLLATRAPYQAWNVNREDILLSSGDSGASGKDSEDHWGPIKIANWNGSDHPAPLLPNASFFLTAVIFSSRNTVEFDYD